MAYNLLILFGICLFAFSQRASAVTEIFRAWQNFHIRSYANAVTVIDNQVASIEDHKESVFASVIHGAQGDGMSSTALGAHASASITVWGWRTNLSGDTYDFHGSFAGAAAMGSEGWYSQSLVDYWQNYEFSVSTITGGEKRSQLMCRISTT